MNLADHVTRIDDGEHPEWAVRCGVCEMLVLMSGASMDSIRGWLNGHHTTPLLPITLVIELGESDQRWREIPGSLLAARPDLAGAAIHHTATGDEEPIYCSFMVAAFLPMKFDRDSLLDVVTAVRSAAQAVCEGAEAAVLPVSGEDYEAALRLALDPLSCGTAAWRVPAAAGQVG